MSQIFYESDNLTITGGGGVWTGWLTSDQEILKTGTIRLIFSIHINGRLKTFFHEFELERAEVFTELWSEWPAKPENYYVLKTWWAWNAVHETLQALGYMLDNKASIMNDWTRRIKYDCDSLWVNSPLENRLAQSSDELTEN